MIDLNTAEINRPEVAAALRALENKRGQLTPEIVYEAARPKDSPLHSCGFDWNQASAALRYNIEVARSLIRTVRYKIEVGDRGVINAPVYVKDPSVTPGYVALRTISSRGPDAHTIVVNEIDAALSHLNRALAIGIVLGFSDEIGKLIKAAETFKAKVEREAEGRKAA